MTTPTPTNVYAPDAEVAARHAARVAEDAQAYEAPQPPEGAHVDAVPVLSGVVPEQSAEQETEGVDMASMPELRSMRGMLPSAQFAVQARMLKLVKDMPDEWRDGEGQADLDVKDMDFDALSDLITGAETFVLDLAKDREAMTDWLIAQENGMQAVMGAFTKATELLGN